MKDKWLVEAVSNNAAWCDAVASSHNIRTSWGESLWLSKQPMPPLYPNIVTLKRGVLVDEIIDSISPQLPLGWGIKDSFNELDLQSKGFSHAFDAHWYCRVPTPGEYDNEYLRFPVESVSSRSDLDRWVAAWGENTGIFNTALLEHECVELLYVERDKQIVSGLITNVSGNTVGLSNAFGPARELLSCVVTMIAKNPDKGIVGYGSDEEIAALANIGFQEIGDLRVWLRK